MTSSWFFLSILNYDARSTTHQIYCRWINEIFCQIKIEISNIVWGCDISCHIPGWKQNAFVAEPLHFTDILFVVRIVCKFSLEPLFEGIRSSESPTKDFWQWHHLQDSCHFKLHCLFIPCSTTSPLVAILTVMRALWEPQDSYTAKTLIERGHCTHHLVTQTWTVCLMCGWLCIVIQCG